MTKETMRVAIPVANGLLCQHFGHCEQFALFEVSPENGELIQTRLVAPPEHAPGVLPQWLQRLGVEVVIAGGMGSRAQALFRQAGIRVITGAPSRPAEEIVKDYVAGTLVTGDNACDH
ncbi:MAG: NifB/NifX family molybdenum-iron cluster-binding protein [Bryobacteraceae bacterium]